MAVKLEHINLVVRIEAINRIYPGGLAACIAAPEHSNAHEERCWHDVHLFRDGTESRGDMRWLVTEWEKKGFQATEIRDGRKVWKDLCVIDTSSGAPSLPCDWIIIDRAKHMAYLKGEEPGIVAGRAA
jgi:hypothetical protein